MYAGPDNSDYGSMNYEVCMEYNVNVHVAGTYYMHVRGRALPQAAGSNRGNADSVNIGLNGAIVESATKISGFSASRFQWRSNRMDGAGQAKLTFSNNGINTIGVCMRENGLAVDAIFITSSSSRKPAYKFDVVSGGNFKLIVEAEKYHDRISDGRSQWVHINSSKASKDKAMYAGPDNSNYASMGYHVCMNYVVDFPKKDTYYVHIRGAARPNAGSRGNADSLNLGINGTIKDTAKAITGFSHINSGFKWSGNRMNTSHKARLYVGSKGERTVNVCMRENGLVVDRIYLTTDRNHVPGS